MGPRGWIQTAPLCPLQPLHHHLAKSPECPFTSAGLPVPLDHSEVSQCISDSCPQPEGHILPLSSSEAVRKCSGQSRLSRLDEPPAPIITCKYFGSIKGLISQPGFQLQSFSQGPLANLF